MRLLCLAGTERRAKALQVLHRLHDLLKNHSTISQLLLLLASLCLHLLKESASRQTLVHLHRREATRVRLRHRQERYHHHQ